MRRTVKRVQAAHAAKHLARLLDEVEAGGEVIIERGSKAVAVIGPASTLPRRISDCLALPMGRPSAVADRDFASDIDDIITTRTDSEPPCWH